MFLLLLQHLKQATSNKSILNDELDCRLSASGSARLSDSPGRLDTEDLVIDNTVFQNVYRTGEIEDIIQQPLAWECNTNEDDGEKPVDMALSWSMLIAILEQPYHVTTRSTLDSPLGESGADVWMPTCRPWSGFPQQVGDVWKGMGMAARSSTIWRKTKDITLHFIVELGTMKTVVWGFILSGSA